MCKVLLCFCLRDAAAAWWDVAPGSPKSWALGGALSSVTVAVAGCRVWCIHRACPQPFPISLLPELLPPVWPSHMLGQDRESWRAQANGACNGLHRRRED